MISNKISNDAFIFLLGIKGSQRRNRKMAAAKDLDTPKIWTKLLKSRIYPLKGQKAQTPIFH